MSADFSEDLSRSELTVSEFAKIMTRLQQLQPQSEDDSINNWQTVSPLIDEHDLAIIAGIADVDESEISEYALGNLPYRFFTPVGPYPYPLVHTTIGAGFTFPNSGKKFAGNCLAAGDTHIKVDHDAWMNVAALAQGVAFWIKKTSTGTYAILCKKDISTTTLAGIHIQIASTTVNCRISDGTNTALLAGTLAALNDGNWHSVIINIPAAGNMEIFFDKVSAATQARGSVASISNSRAAYIFGEDNAGTIEKEYDGNAALFIWKKNEIFDATDITDFHDNGYYDLTDGNASKDIEVITIPYMDIESAMPNATVGRCAPS